ncbi:glycosyltransferase family 2 protein [Methanoculleus thermophilus]|jgi:glycosyltransferase involved in cell wall biosynthesis|uniref:Glycosyl transferase family 2 n=1 Tax=Methanoculleus thermophilus TaxID=2200 RepID=A0A1G9BM83_9EURY|nr:glycosyltransferase family 2 protein [Methanoculleus thermophilus]SDK40639.1 Glycosyl transferase family 2 [Methanoculleus thermophilus]HQD27131.1 glycosyltransferase family 2 protein [Methanoculleus thermophilus]
MNDCKISIITVCFNCEELIDRTIKSVVEQSYTNIQYIIIDGLSSDRTLEIVKKYEKYIEILVSEKDDGIYDAMNKGLKYATGDLVYFLNAGDYLYNSDVLKNIAERFCADPDNDIFYGDYIYYDVVDEQRCSSYRTGIQDLIRRGYCHQTTFAKRSTFTKYGGFNTNYKIYADFDWLLRVLIGSGQSMKYIGIPVVYYLKGGESENQIITNYLERIKVIWGNMGIHGLLLLGICFPSIIWRYLIKQMSGSKKLAEIDGIEAKN